MLRTWSAAAVGFALTAALAPLSAQSSDGRSVHIGAMAGGSIPIGILSDASKAGGSAGLLVSFGHSSAPLRLRIDGQWHHMGEKGALVGYLRAPGGGGGYLPEPIAMRILDATANVEYDFRRGSPTIFYLIGGAGVYAERATASAYNSRGDATKFGLNAGAGVRVKLGALDGFLEARYHNVLHGSDVGDYAFRSPAPKSLQFVPISLGVIF
jgi:opacity protein-like surface antigen